jgi:hypothetical protein
MSQDPSEGSDSQDDPDRPPPPTPVRSGDVSGGLPTPVRDLMGAPEVEPPEPSLTGAERSLEDGENTWVVRSGGRTRSGTAPDSGAPLLLLLFFRVEGDDAPKEDPDREAWAVAASLADLSDTQLRLYLSRARPS